MFSGFWSWVLVVMVVAVIFYYDKLPQLKDTLEELRKNGAGFLHQKRKSYEEKICKKIEIRDGLHKKNKEDSDDKPIE